MAQYPGLKKADISIGPRDTLLPYEVCKVFFECFEKMAEQKKIGSYVIDDILKASSLGGIPEPLSLVHPKALAQYLCNDVA